MPPSSTTEPQRRGRTNRRPRRQRRWSKPRGGSSTRSSRFEWLLLQFLQTVTAYVDTKDRSEGGPELREQLALIQQRLVMVEREMTRRSSGTDSSRPEHVRPRRRPARPASVFADLGRPCISASRIASAARTAQHSRTARVVPAALRDAPATWSTSAAAVASCSSCCANSGVTARGIDTNQAMVERMPGARARRRTDGRADVSARARATASLGGLIAIQVVEHFEPAYLVRVLELAYQKLRPGAPLVLETINPACWMAFFEALHPRSDARATAASRHAALPRAGQRLHERQRRYRQPVTEADRLERVSAAGRRPTQPIDGDRRRAQRPRRQAQRTAVFVDGLRDRRQATIMIRVDSHSRVVEFGICATPLGGRRSRPGRRECESRGRRRPRRRPRA